ncbi:lipopolysaccharide biosynthesis protein [Methylocystis bryophila]|uniref:lipopolysaccharide biosynthesis protein n=1 Tax=Methylocystis bryophila TaxID=655015 RepID=UPI003DB149A0
MNHAEEPRGPQPFSPLERTQAISRALNEAARRARFSSRARGSYEKSSFSARRGARLMRIIRWVLFVLLVVVPNVVALAYFGLLASDQYVSEAQFTVSSGAIPKMDGLGSVTGVPPMMIVQDTQIVTNFIESRAMVESLERDVDLRELYGSGSIDWWARFNKKKPIEKFTDYWEKMVKTSISFPAGIVTLTIRAFTAADAKRIADAIIARCETLINGLNDRMRLDTVSAAETDLFRAGEKLKTARLQMEQARNAEQLVDVRQTSASLSQLLSERQTELLKAPSEYQTQLQYVLESAPQMRVLKTRMTSLEAQIQKMKAQITEQQEKNVEAVAEKALSGKMTKFANLDLEQAIAEKRYAASAATLEAARMLAQRKMLYLHPIVAPAEPQEARYPKRWLSIGMTLVASLVGYGVVVGIVGFVRNNMA